MRSGCGGPCSNCNRVSSPCWRKGPADRPLLCNACGARWLVKGTLDGYTPHGPIKARRAGSAPPRRTPKPAGSEPKRPKAPRVKLEDLEVLRTDKRQRKATQRFSEDGPYTISVFGAEEEQTPFLGSRRSPVKADSQTQTCFTEYHGLRHRGHQATAHTSSDSMQTVAGEEHFNHLAVSTLALLRRHSSTDQESESDSGHSGHITAQEAADAQEAKRQRRKPTTPTIRTLF